MEKILVPTDFSPEAENALKVASQLARKYNSKIYLLHMLELPMDLINPVMGTRTNDPPEVIYFLKLAQKKLAEIRQKDYMNDLRVQEIIQFHSAFEGIMESSKNQECDLIIMGSKGASGFKDMFIGSNTEKVVRTSETPVLVIKKEHPQFEVKDMVFATEFSQECRRVLPQVIRFAKVMEAKLHLVYINTADNFLSSKDVDQQMEDFTKEVDFNNFSFNVFNDNTVEDGILNFAKKINADLVGVATHGRKGLSHFFNGSISEDLANHAKRPVVTFRL